MDVQHNKKWHVGEYINTYELEAATAITPLDLYEIAESATHYLWAWAHHYYTKNPGIFCFQIPSKEEMDKTLQLQTKWFNVGRMPAH
jgi:hypothetical protein